MYDLRHLCLQFIDKLFGIVFLVFDVTKFLFPDTSQLTTLQQFLPNQVDEFNSCGGGDETFAVAFDIVTFEKGLDDASTTRRTADTVLLHGGTQRLVLHELTGCLHRTKQ